MGVQVTNFTAAAYDSGVLLAWTSGYGQSGSAATDMCKVTIQYSDENFPHNFPNTPPYAVRDLQQPQGTYNLLWHPCENDTEYYYSLFIYYFDSGFWHGAYNPLPTPVTPQAVIGAPFTEGILSYSKLEANTKISSAREIAVDIIVWLPEDSDGRKSMIEATLNDIKPAHVKLRILYERYYIAATTSNQFNASNFNSAVYKVEDGAIINKVATIDSSCSGQSNILGGV